MTLLKETFSYTSKERFGTNIPSKEIPLGTGESLKNPKICLKTKIINSYEQAQEGH